MLCLQWRAAVFQVWPLRDQHSTWGMSGWAQFEHKPCFNPSVSYIPTAPVVLSEKGLPLKELPVRWAHALPTTYWIQPECQAAFSPGREEGKPKARSAAESDMGHVPKLHGWVTAGKCSYPAPSRVQFLFHPPLIWQGYSPSTSPHHPGLAWSQVSRSNSGEIFSPAVVIGRSLSILMPQFPHW